MFMNVQWLEFLQTTPATNATPGRSSRAATTVIKGTALETVPEATPAPQEKVEFIAKQTSFDEEMFFSGNSTQAIEKRNKRKERRSCDSGCWFAVYLIFCIFFN